MNFLDIIVLEPSIHKIIVRKKDFSFSYHRSLKMDSKVWPVEIALEERCVHHCFAQKKEIVPSSFT